MALCSRCALQSLLQSLGVDCAAVRGDSRLGVVEIGLVEFEWCQILEHGRPLVLQLTFLLELACSLSLLFALPFALPLSLAVPSKPLL